MAEKKTRKKQIDFSLNFAVAICLRADPKDTAFLESNDYTTYVTKKLSLFDSIAASFRQKKIGQEYDRDADNIRLLCTFPLPLRESFIGKKLLPLIQKIETATDCHLLCGIGQISANQLHLNESLQTAREACDLSFFEQGSIFDYREKNRRADFSLEDYEIYSEKAFKAILIKSPDALSQIDDCLDLIKKIHYGNRQAVIMREMNFTGEMAYRLHRYNLLDSDFYSMQDRLQEAVLSAKTFEEVKSAIHEYYQSLLSEINQKSRTGRKTLTEQVKSYIRENYMEDISVKDLAAIACVSTGYFSHMFKNETGLNYKSYLTGIRLEEAAELLLSSDLRLYEISDRVGYKNVRNFTEAFRKQYGVSPSLYRRKMQKI